ncbi:MAG TPA: hypothetical protein VG755_11665 [Nannocystaceae bacterium]|nr:hypothetical protein [Nannocystaceae bacterium]
MPDNPPEPRTQSTADLDAGWGELLDGIGHSHPVELAPATPAVAEPVPVDEQDPRELDVAQKKSANEMLAQMARMLDVGEGTGPVVDLRRVLAPSVEGAPSSAPTSAPAPLIPPRVVEPELEMQSEVDTPPALDKLPAPSERTVVTKRPRDDAPLLLELDDDDGPRPIDARDDAPRLLAVSDGVPQPIVEGEESWPRRETPRPKRASESSMTSQRLPKVEPTGPIARVADTGPRPTATAARSQWPWIAGAAALVVAIGWAVLRPSTPGKSEVVQASASGQPAARKGDAAAAATIADPRPATAAIRSGDEKVAVVSPHAINEASAKNDPPAAKPEPVEAKPEPIAAPEPVAAAAPAPVAAAEPADAAPVKAASSSASITGTPEELLAAADAALSEQRFEDAHALARRSWDAEHDNAAVRVMAIAACELQDGALARSAFRKLKGPDVRSEVYAACRKRAVDVRSNIDGYTPAELVVKATRALEQGEHDQAYELAKSSNKLEHTSAAMGIMAMAACHKHDADEAAHLVGMLTKARKQEVLAACKASGTELP